MNLGEEWVNTVKCLTDLQNKKKKYAELKNTMTEIKKKESTVDFMIQRKGSASWKTVVGSTQVEQKKRF